MSLSRARFQTRPLARDTISIVVFRLRVAATVVVATLLAIACSPNDGGRFSEDLGSSSGSGDTPSEDEPESLGSTGEALPGSTTGGDADGLEPEAPFVPDPSWTQWAIRAPSYAVPTEETTYACFGVSIPVDRLRHVVAFEPVIDDSSVVHHMVLATTAAPFHDLEPCYPAPLGASMQWGWAPGAGPFVVPEDTGFLVGNTGPEVHWVIQIHYSNPLLQSGHVDASGVDVHVAEELRAHDAGVFSTGDVAGLAIPAGQESWPTIHVCSDPVEDADPFHVFGSWLHAHRLGRALFTELRRDGQVVAEIGRHDPYHFDAQHFEVLDATVEPGDALWTHCIYDSTERTEPTLGGGGTDDEMCINYLMYWPRRDWLGHCNDD